MILTLLSKELRQHWLGFLALLAAGGLTNLLILAAGLAPGSAESSFEGLRSYTILMSVLGALVLNHRLVVLEYQAKTQLFLEALPVARWRMVAVKYALGLGILWLLVGIGFASACLLAWRHGELAPRFAGLVAVRALSLVWLVHSFCFLMGLTGRYRLALYLAMLVVGVILIEHKAVGISGFGPIVLLDTRFGYEREMVPWQALGVTWGLSLVFTLLAATLSLVREGSIAALLAEKMSHREKVLIAAMLCGLMFAGATLSEKAKKEPFDLKQAAAAHGPGVSVKVASGEGEGDPVSARLANNVANELAALREYLGLKEVPPVFIVRRRDLDPDRYERGELVHAEGIHVQANFTAKDWQEAPFLAWLVPEVLAAASQDRLKHESNRWVLDGFGLFWVGRDHADADLAEDKTLTLRALYGVEDGLVLADLRRWLSFRERVGESVASAVAWSGLKTLARRQGLERSRVFLRAVLGAQIPKDFRVLLRDTSWDHRLRDQVGENTETFLNQWQAELASARHRLKGELAQLPRLSGQVFVVPLSAESRKVQFRLRIEPAPAGDVRYSFLYQQLSFFDQEADVKSLQREQNSYTHSPAAELPETYARGQRLRWTFALEVPALGCQVISGYTRQDIP
jgi:hypothetical protein